MLNVDIVLQEDGQAARSFLELGYWWHLTSRQTVGVQHTFSEYKTDLDVTALYRYSTPVLGHAEVALTIQNLYSDLIDQRLGITPNDRDIIRDYARPQGLLSVSYVSPDRYPLRGELIVAVQPLSRATYASQTTPAYRYRDDERLHHVGALLEHRFSSFSAGLFYKGDVSWLRRVGAGSEVSSDYTARQHFRRVGGFLKGHRGSLRGVLRGFAGSYRDRQTGSDYAESLLPRHIDYEERQRGLQARMLYELDSGPMLGVEYAAYGREYDEEDDPGQVGTAIVFAPWTKQYWGLGPSNHQLVGLVGYRFSRGRIVAGVGYDLDGDDDYPTKDLATRRFDGGFGRFVLTW